MEILNYSFDGEGMQRVFENEKWTVGIKNWKPANDITGMIEDSNTSMDNSDILDLSEDQIAAIKALV